MLVLRKVVIFGIGMIGSSFARAIKNKFDAEICISDKNSMHIEQAVKLGIANREANGSDIEVADLVIISVPVDQIAKCATDILNKIREKTIVLDTGSIKSSICKAILQHPRRGNFVASHPIAGNEYSGPKAGSINMFEGKKNIICDKEFTNPEILDKALDFFNCMGLTTLFMNSNEHDKHLAYVSHLSHVSSFMLGKTILQIEKDEKNIGNLAGSGFESTVRLAKSSPVTWTPIFIENKNNVLNAVEEYISNLQEFVQLLKENDKDSIFHKLEDINRIEKLLK